MTIQNCNAAAVAVRRTLFDRILPVFTQYSEPQFAWMREGSPSPVWPAFYADRCGLVMSSELLQKCRNTKRID
jgi:hypothetical protein